MIRRIRLSLWRLAIRRLAILTVLATTPIQASDIVQGRIETLKGSDGARDLTLLRVWGSPHEMGYAHGFLLGDKLTGVLNDIVSTLAGANADEYRNLRTRVAAFIDLPENARLEIQGIIAGAAAANGGTAPELPIVGQPLTEDDLAFLHSLDVFRAFACSGFTAWDEQSRTGALVTARTFDFSAFSKRTLSSQIILVRRPADENAVATVTFPGYIGAYTAVNEHGVCAFIHDGDATRSIAPESRYTPTTLAVKDALEQADDRDVYKKAKRIFREAKTPFSYMVRIVTPRGKEPVRIFRLDPSGVSEAKFRESPCVTTNHYVESLRDGAVGQGDSYDRFRGILAHISDTSESPITWSQAAWKAMNSVSRSHERNTTLHAVVVFPREERLELSLASWESDIVSATRNPVLRLTFAELFDAR